MRHLLTIPVASFFFLLLLQTIEASPPAPMRPLFPESDRSFECPRFYNAAQAETIFHNIVKAAAGNKLKDSRFKNASNRENAWAWLAYFVANLPRWRRTQTILRYCHSQLKMNVDIDECVAMIFDDRKGIGNLKKPGLVRGLILQMYDQAAQMFKMLVKEKGQALGELLYAALEPKANLEAVYEILLGRPRVELLQMLEAYPFEAQIKKKYGQNAFNLLRYQNEGHVESTLRVHLMLKKQFSKDGDRRLIYELLAERMRLIQEHEGFDDAETEQIFDNIKDHCNSMKGINDLVPELEKLLHNFEFKSKGAFKFGAQFVIFCRLKLQKYDVKSHKDEAVKPNYSQSYLRQLLLMLDIGGLSSGKNEYFMDTKERLKRLHRKGDVDGVIRFLTLHLDDDLGNVLRNYGIEHKELDKELTFAGYFVRLGNRQFQWAYKQILDQAWRTNDSSCYFATQKEYGIEMALGRLVGEKAKMSKLLHIGMSLTAMQTNLVPTSSEPSSPSATATAAAHSHKGINRACLPNLVLSNQLSILESLIDAKLELESNDGIKELEQVTYRYLQSDKARVGDSDGSCLLEVVRDTVGQYCKERVKKVLGKFKRRVPRTLTLDHLNRIHEQMQWRGEVPDEELVNYWYWHRNIKHQIDDLEEFCDRDVKALEHRELGDEFLRIFNDVLAESRNGKTVDLFAHGTAAAAAGPESMALTSGPIAEQSTTFIGRESIKGITKEAEESHQPQFTGILDAVEPNEENTLSGTTAAGEENETRK